MYSIKIEDSHGEISGSVIKLRSKFVKKFSNLQIQKNVIRTIESLNKASILDVFKFLMKSAASKDFLAQETHVEWLELTDEHSKIIWNEIRSQVNSNFRIFPCGDVFENTCEPFVKIWEDSTFDLAIGLFKSVVKYLDCHSQDQINRALFLLGSDMSNYNFGGIQELGFRYEEAVQYLKFSCQVYGLMDGLNTNNCYFSAIPLLSYLEENVQSETSEVAEKTSKVSELENTEASNFEEASIEVSSFNRFSLNKGALDFSTDGVVDFIKNYELFKGFLVAVGGLREIQVDPQFILDNEEEFIKLIDVIDQKFQNK